MCSPFYQDEITAFYRDENNCLKVTKKKEFFTRNFRVSTRIQFDNAEINGRSHALFSDVPRMF